LAGLTVRSRQEDRYGVAQLTGCNAAVMTTLLSTLVAFETCLQTKTTHSLLSCKFKREAWLLSLLCEILDQRRHGGISFVRFLVFMLETFFHDI
jgi:hypothetical protein